MGVGRRPKPKARDPNKREMSEDEKQKLRVEIESLPEEKMVNVLQIVQKRSTDPALRGEVVELDFDEMDVETLWELDRFVVNCKKVLKKGRHSAVMNGDAAMAPVIPVEDDMVTVNVDSPTVVDIGESSVRHWEDNVLISFLWLRNAELCSYVGCVFLVLCRRLMCQRRGLQRLR